MLDAEREVAAMINHQYPAAAQRFNLEYGNPGGYWHASQTTVERLNAFFRYKLALVPVDTLHQRECLCDSPDVRAWVSNFRRLVLPTIMLYVYAPALIEVQNG